MADIGDLTRRDLLKTLLSAVGFGAASSLDPVGFFTRALAQVYDPRTVDQILASTSFSDTTPETYGTEVGNNKHVFVMVYVEDDRNNGLTKEGSRRLATVMAEVAPRHPEVVFLKYQDNRNARERIGSGYDHVPAFFMFSGGQEVLKSEVGPNKGTEHLWVQRMEEKFQQKYV